MFSSVVVVFLVGGLLSIVGQHKPGPAVSLLEEIHSLQLNSTPFLRRGSARRDPEAVDRASTDFGLMTRAVPAAVFRPSSDRDIAALVGFSYASARPFGIAPRGRGHSVRGQALARDAVVVDMGALRGDGQGRIRVCGEGCRPSYVDAGGEQLWIDVLRETMKHGLAPRSWTDYLYLTVGGTLSNAGISGQTFLYGPQISNVYELDVITGTNHSSSASPDHPLPVLCSPGRSGPVRDHHESSDRHRASSNNAFTSDQERLISLEKKKGFNYVEGSVIMANSLTNNWRSSFYVEEDITRISRLAAQYGAVYCLEAAKYYDDATAPSIDQVNRCFWRFQGSLECAPSVAQHVDPQLQNTRVRSRGLQEHPQAQQLGGSDPDLRHEQEQVSAWDRRTSAVVPDEEVFYAIGLLRSGMDGWKNLEEQNEETLRFCDDARISYKQYLPHYTSLADWRKHFGAKWDVFVERKMRYDPRALLSPGQRIFTSSFAQHQSM
ncbi:hypothetical protein B296_00053792 [Ensete ventricosum]|uniref:cytokinin dehydrogenase n=1 Tax=Ensete ventricosum TaxID=4639 RepID=A0A426XT70_ENSVE|nr:hypothetical protein B296_00053792 [Ensete ventricosum]